MAYSKSKRKWSELVEHVEVEVAVTRIVARLVKKHVEFGVTRIGAKLAKLVKRELRQPL